MNIFVLIPALVSIFLGILILVFPKFLRIMMGLYFLFVGILGLIYALL